MYDLSLMKICVCMCVCVCVKAIDEEEGVRGITSDGKSSLLRLLERGGNGKAKRKSGGTTTTKAKGKAKPDAAEKERVSGKRYAPREKETITHSYLFSFFRELGNAHSHPRGRCLRSVMRMSNVRTYVRTYDKVNIGGGD